MKINLKKLNHPIKINQKKYFDNELQEADIESFNWIEYENEDIKIKKVLNNNE